MDISLEIRKLKNDNLAKSLSKFFKTKKGEYAEGDIFLGIPVPKQRELANIFWTKIDFEDLKKLIKSKFHEERFIALLILIKKYEHGINLKRIFNFYLDNKIFINNWDLVDLSAPKILGTFLLDKKKDVLYSLARSKNLWDKRISIITTFTFIKQNNFRDSINISKILLEDSHDLIRKAVGWMLREIGKRDLGVLESFLDKNYNLMSRLTLRYAIEKMEISKRNYYLSKQ
jgi:3-methyladenine DNA glycosylase AlkD